MDDTTNRCRMFKGQLDLLLDKFEVYSKAITEKSIRKLTLFFPAHRSFYADTSPTRGNSLYFEKLRLTLCSQCWQSNKPPAPPHTQSDDLNIHERSEFSCPR